MNTLLDLAAIKALRESPNFDGAVSAFAKDIRQQPRLLMKLARYYLEIRKSVEGHITVAPRGAYSAVPSTDTKKRRAKRGVESIGEVQALLTKSVFDRYVLPDGRSLRQVQWFELPTLAKTYRSASRVLHALYQHVTPMDTTATVDNIVNESVVLAAIDKAEAANDLA